MRVKVPRSGNGKPNGHYHTRDCRNCPTEYRTISLEDARDKLGWEECKYCSGEAKQAKPKKQPLRRLVEQGKV